MNKKRTIDSFFKKKSSENIEDSVPTSVEPSPSNFEASILEHRPLKASKRELKEDKSSFERDPGLRQQILKYSLNERDEIRRAYIKAGPYQHSLSQYPLNEDKHPCHFQASWFKLFSNWLEYSPTKDAIYCLPYYLFTKPNGRPGSSAFTIEGFQSWKKVNNGTKCALLHHVGKGPNSLHKIAVKCCHGLACAFRGHDECLDSSNRGNFIELIKILAAYNEEEVGAVVLDKAPQNVSYISHGVQKDILCSFAKKIQNIICEEIDDAKFCILVNESRDESRREQMAIVLRFVNKEGFIWEHFFDLVHVPDTTPSTLKKEISNVLDVHNLSIQNIRGQGYHGASNMCGAWNGLQALFLNDCHRLQLALIAASREVIPIHQFFSYLTLVVNIVGSSCKRLDQLKDAQGVEIAKMLAIDELETVLRNIVSDGASYTQRGDADGAYDATTSFEFIFILHLMREIMEITDDLCQALQCKSQDILNAMHLVSTTKALVQKLREDWWDLLFENVKLFYEKHKIEVPDMSARYCGDQGRSHSQRDHITIEHHLRVDVFIAAVDSQLQELNNLFKEDVVELLILSSALDSRDAYKSFNIDDICKLANKFYPKDFTEQDKLHLKYQLELYVLDIHENPLFQKVSTISELCQLLMKTRKAPIYPLVDRLIRLVLTLPVSTATTKRTFSAISLVKTKLRNKMEDDFLANYLITYVEKEIARDFDIDSIINEFNRRKDCRAQLEMPKFNR